VPVLTHPQGWFTLEIPDGWAMETEDSVTTLRSPMGVGIVYLSGARHSRGRQPSFGGADFLRRFLDSLGIEVEDEAIALAQGLGCRIYSYVRDSGGTHWRYWSVTDDETALLISYTCETAESTRETGEVDEMVRSVRLYHSAPVH
jgi:hypothetical protein